MHALPLTCDLGEGFDDIDSQIIPLIDLASIACGGHAGTLKSVEACVGLALANRVSIGAHPSYPDKANFGRVSLDLSAEEISRVLAQQLDFVQAVCLQRQARVDYVKPHGALYNDMMKNLELFQAVLRGVAAFKIRHRLDDCKLLIQALPQRQSYIEQAREQGVSLLFEAFADRSYLSSGLLASRGEANALITSPQAISKQAENIFRGFVMTLEDQRLALSADCLCIHSDNPAALEAVGMINKLKNLHAGSSAP